jgi:hypothetical protein
MKKIPRNRVRSHADFDLTPLGMWAVGRDAATSIPGAPHLRLPNPFIDEPVTLHSEGMTYRRAHEKSPGARRGDSVQTSGTSSEDSDWRDYNFDFCGCIKYGPMASRS